jgi:hypothetical protein
MSCAYFFDGQDVAFMSTSRVGSISIHEQLLHALS